jgi:hypothetical protein
VGSRRGGAETVTLCHADLVIYELDGPELGRRLGKAMGLTPGWGDIEGVPHAMLVGMRNALTSDEMPAYAVLQAAASELSATLVHLAARCHGRFTVLTPTRVAWRGWPPGLRDRAEVLAMDEAFVVTSVGAWHLAPPVASTTESKHKGTAGRSPGPADAAVGGYVPTPNEMLVLRVLARSSSRMRYADLHVALEADRNKRSRNTIRDAVVALRDLGFINFPNGDRGGMVIDAKGRALPGITGGRVRSG